MLFLINSDPISVVVILTTLSRARQQNRHLKKSQKPVSDGVQNHIEINIYKSFFFKSEHFFRRVEQFLGEQKLGNLFFMN